MVRSRIDTPLGPMTAAASPLGLVGLWFDDQRHGPAAELVEGWSLAPDHPVLVRTREQLAAYFDEASGAFDLPLDLSHGTPFQRSVWQALLALPYGATCSYGAVAERLQAPQAVRAVAAAIGRNPIGIVVPCHRVLGANGALTGYAGGLHRKAALLQLEARAH
ncbi:MAG: methylated-DNA--[protein]-cysteine S-methyltransferase [Hydrogenophaga sp.]|nr:methylated-DNA--[protein]-cysteine S-methyltransferase [Hydrogenophaga sp.]